MEETFPINAIVGNQWVNLGFALKVSKLLLIVMTQNRILATSDFRRKR